MNPQLLIVATLGGVLIGALLIWLLLRGQAVGAQTATNNAFARLDQQLGSLAQATPAELARVREALLAALSQQRQEFGGALAQTQQGV